MILIIYFDPFLFLDFEAFNKKLPQPITDSKTEKKTKHKPSGFAYKRISTDPRYRKPIVKYTGDDVALTFLEMMEDEQIEIEKILKKITPMNLTPIQEMEFQKAEYCHICEKKFYKNSKNIRVRDHDHLTGEYRGPSHQTCNLKFKNSYKLKVFMHNAKNYDTHLIMQGVSKFSPDKVTCIPQNAEKYISFTIDKIEFVDSYQFLSTSLATLTKNLLSSGKENFKNVASDMPAGCLDLLCQKSAFPYTWFDSKEKLKETALPPIEAFHNDLTNEDCSQEAYDHSQAVWKRFEMQTFQDYHDFYMKMDILLLADCFEYFRDVCLERYGLDPCHYYTCPGLSWDAMLKTTGVELELIQDYDKYLMFESGIRGALSCISDREGIPNNPDVPNFNPEQPTSYIFDLGMNKLW